MILRCSEEALSISSLLMRGFLAMELVFLDQNGDRGFKERMGRGFSTGRPEFCKKNGQINIFCLVV